MKAKMKRDQDKVKKMRSRRPSTGKQRRPSRQETQEKVEQSPDEKKAHRERNKQVNPMKTAPEVIELEESSIDDVEQLPPSLDVKSI